MPSIHPQVLTVLGRLSLLVVALLAAGCLPDDPVEIDPRALPIRVEVVRSFPGRTMAADLDADGWDELIWYAIPSELAMSSGGSVRIVTQEGLLIAQENFQGFMQQRPVVADLDGNGTREVILSIVRNDSLFGQVLGHRGQIGPRFFITSGQPRLQWPNDDENRTAVPDTMPWDPRVMHLYARDLEGDGDRELLSVVYTGYARQPRGVVVHSLPELRKEAELTIGAGIAQWRAVDADPHVQDFDRDGALEFVWPAESRDNGAVAGGFRDDRSYVILFELSPPEVAWSEMLGAKSTQTMLDIADFDGDGSDDWLVGLASEIAGQTADIRVLDPATKRAIVRRPSPETLRRLRAAELDGDPEPEVLALGRSGTLYAYDHTLRRTSTTSWPRRMEDMRIFPDADGDGRSELITTAGGRSYLVDGDVRVQAALPEGVVLLQVVEQGTGEPRLLLGHHTGELRSALLRLTPQPFWWAYRYGPGAGVVLVLSLVGLLSVFAARRHHEAQLKGLMLEHLQRDPADLVVLADERGHPREVSPRLRSLLHLNSRADREALREHAPELYGLLGELRTSPSRREHLVTVEGQPVTVHAEPLPVGRRTYWLLRLRPAQEQAEPSEAWRLMARRVAHDLKNPLTAILLTVQRMQREAEDASPEAGERLEPHAKRVADRVEHLRRMTRTFMKVTGIEEPELERGDLARFVERLAEAMQAELPPDVELVVHRGEAPTVAFDREQMRSVLENLVTNAITAMPDGGTVTLSVSEGKGLLVGEEPRDYAVIEVLDTGTGMSEEVRQRAFEAGYTTSPEGTGVGLAVVEQVVQRHGGAVEVRSEEGVGTEVCLYLPEG